MEHMIPFCFPKPRRDVDVWSMLACICSFHNPPHLCVRIIPASLNIEFFYWTLVSFLDTYEVLFFILASIVSRRMYQSHKGQSMVVLCSDPLQSAELVICRKNQQTALSNTACTDQRVFEKMKKTSLIASCCCSCSASRSLLHVRSKLAAWPQPFGTLAWTTMSIKAMYYIIEQLHKSPTQPLALSCTSAVGIRLTRSHLASVIHWVLQPPAPLPFPFNWQRLSVSSRSKMSWAGYVHVYAHLLWVLNRSVLSDSRSLWTERERRSVHFFLSISLFSTSQRLHT